MFVKEETRQLARVVKIDELNPIPKADRLEMAVVGGWEVIVQKGLYKVDDLAVFFEIDAAIPMDSPVMADFDRKYLLVRKDEETEKEYAVIRSLRLRKMLSQGLLIPVSKLDLSMAQYAATKAVRSKGEDIDLTEKLGVLKYVTPQEWKQYQTQLRLAEAVEEDSWWVKLRLRLVKGIVISGMIAFPRGHIKSEEDRVQNLSKNYRDLVASGETFEATYKFDGESAMVFVDLDTGEIGIAQRNFALRTEAVPYTFKESLRVYVSAWMRYVPRRIRGGACSFPRWKTQYDPFSVPLVKHMTENGVVGRIRAFNEANGEGDPELSFCTGKKIAVQGEAVGPNFNGNAEGLTNNAFYVYRVYGNGSYVFPPEQARLIVKSLGLQYIPTVDTNLVLPPSIKELLALADGPSFFDPKRLREGLVLKSNTGDRSFKVISNKWLENEVTDL